MKRIAVDRRRSEKRTTEQLVMGAELDRQLSRSPSLVCADSMLSTVSYSTTPGLGIHPRSLFGAGHARLPSARASRSHWIVTRARARCRRSASSTRRVARGGAFHAARLCKDIFGNRLPFQIGREGPAPPGHWRERPEPSGRWSGRRGRGHRRAPARTERAVRRTARPLALRPWSPAPSPSLHQALPASARAGRSRRRPRCCLWRGRQGPHCQSRRAPVEELAGPDHDGDRRWACAPGPHRSRRGRAPCGERPVEAIAPPADN
jgi:hypothetical protein